ncbi:MAG: hypothetical protein JWP57_568 [Spirosoma sp.]|nr:hypothetical protein [Spirosoma sp.]
MPNVTQGNAKPKPKIANFGKWLTYAEAIKSATSLAYGIKNEPTQIQYDRMKHLRSYLCAPVLMGGREDTR